MNLDGNYWEQKHASSDTPWCLHRPSPPLTAYFEQVSDKQKSILIPGAGHHYDALWLLNNGFENVTICDISETAITHIKRNIGPSHSIKYIHDDFFNIEETFDTIVEQTFFCALHPSLRKRYAQKITQLLNPGGTWVGVLFASPFEKMGPPFGGEINEYKTLFHNYLEITNISMCYNSAKPRQDNELFIICKKSKC